MESKDLRVGNLIMFGAMRHDCKPCDIKNLYQIEIIDSENTEYKPIHLTSEWVKKFNYYYNVISDLIIQVDRFKLIWKPAYKYWYVVDLINDTYITKVEFVHEWQNVYFVLNGIEIKLN